MAASAAILILWPGQAAAEVCDKGGAFWTEFFPSLQNWISTNPLKPQLEFLLSPVNWVTGVLMIWMILSKGPRATIVGACWFALIGCFHAFAYFSIDLNEPYYRAAISEGCVVNSPYRAFVNFAFAAAAVFLTVQRRHQRPVG